MTYPNRARRRQLTTRVRSVTEVTGHMREIELVGPELPSLRRRPGAHLVVHVPAGNRPARRVYSIWSHTSGSAALTIRVALHGTDAPGCVWAREVRPDDRVTVEQPRTKITLADTAACHLFVGDETGAVPLLAMHADLHRSRPTSSVFGVFESADGDDEVPGFPGVPPLPWAHRGTASAAASRVLLRAVQELELPGRGGAAYVAGESATCRLIQRHLVEQRGWPMRSIRVQQQWLPGRSGFGAGTD